MTGHRGSGPVGVLLAGLLAGWALLARPGAPGGPAVAGMVLVGVLAWWAGGLLAHVHPALPGGAVGGLSTVAILAGGSGALSGVALAAPLGYSNANAAMLTAGVAGFLTAAGHADPTLRRKLVIAALALAVLTIATASLAGAAACILLLGVWPLLGRGRRGIWQLVSGATIVAAVAVTAWLGAAQEQQRPEVVEATLSSGRTDLWSDAVHMAMREPVLGVGAGNFAMQSDVASSDSDMASPHSAPLRVLAELGFVGLGLFAALTAWMILSLRRGAALLAVIALQPTVDYVLEFPAVVVASAVVLGAVAVSGIGKPGFTPPAP